MYAHLNPVSLKPFYIGKGKDARFTQQRYRSDWWSNYTNVHGFIPIKLVDGLSNEQACEIEKQYISKYGFLKSGGLLINLTIGGTGGNTFDPINNKNWNSGKTGVYSPEVIERIRASRIGQTLKGEHRIKVLEGLKKASLESLKSRTHKVKCLVTGKVWNGRQECIGELKITLHTYKQRILRNTEIKGYHLQLIRN